MSGGYLAAHPFEADCLNAFRRTGQMVPIARGGKLLHLVTWRKAALDPLPKPLPVEDFVVGLELLGFTLQLLRLRPGSDESVVRGEPTETLPSSWDRHALRIAEAFGRGRRDEIVTFLHGRTRP